MDRRRLGHLLGRSVVIALALLAGCASRPAVPDGPPLGLSAQQLERLLQTPDAQPRPEPIRAGGPNKAYGLNGRLYVPLAADAPLREQGLASWYGRAYHGQPTASGERYDMFAMSAAHPTLPLPSYVRVRNPANQRSVVVRINDRGPFVDGRIIDLSYTAALRLGVLNGVREVEIERVFPEPSSLGLTPR
ncbi:MAG: septal ring lytic transglycosylase RlpA family protein [Leptothrix ochracea]|uniref:septal ring lytic transglycosylase RlpA family protein n=2 Tax=Leptothrix ochracea TaxID=735331 RepID=UPI0034E1BA91